MKLAYDVSRCTGHFVGDKGFGLTLNPHCIDCQRRTQTDHHKWRQPWMTAEPFDTKCAFKITSEK